MGNLIGRKKEIEELSELYNSNKAEFVAIYGRRRIGKTFLVDEALKGKITFRHAGLSPVDEANEKNSLKNQLVTPTTGNEKKQMPNYMDGSFLHALPFFGEQRQWHKTSHISR